VSISTEAASEIRDAGEMRAALRRVLRPVRRVWWKSTNRLAAVLRRSRYVGSGILASAVPRRFWSRFGLDDDLAVRSHRLEIGSGRRPQPGYVHVDPDWCAPHAEFFSYAWRLPFPDGWADEVLSIHLLEHVHPRRLRETLSEWRRVLRHGGRIEVHVPDSARLMRAYICAPPKDKWRLIGALLGMYANAGVATPEELTADADHQLLLDAPLLETVLREAGFTGVRNISACVSDAHTEGWRDVVGRLSLVIEAYKDR
jgi:SAM-dependent methyltransferase